MKGHGDVLVPFGSSIHTETQSRTEEDAVGVTAGSGGPASPG